MISLSDIDVGKMIRLAQFEQEITNKELAKRLGVTQQSVSNYRKAKNIDDIKLARLAEICEALGLELKITIN